MIRRPSFFHAGTFTPALLGAQAEAYLDVVLVVFSGQAVHNRVIVNIAHEQSAASQRERARHQFWRSQQPESVLAIHTASETDGISP